MGTFVISDFSDLEKILTPAGYPLLQETEFPISFAEMTRLIISTAYAQYERYNPFELITYQQVGTTFDIPFPSVDVFGIVDARLAIYQNSGGYGVTGNFWADVRQLAPQGFNPTRNGVYMTRDALLTQEVEARTWINIRKAGKLEIDWDNSVVHGSSSMLGELELKWAVRKYDFSAIPYSKKPDAIRLAQSHVLRFIGMLDSQQLNNTGLSFDSSNFIQRADALEESVLTKWRNRVKPIILKG